MMTGRGRRRQRGLAALFALALVALMAVLAVANSRTTAQLRQELRLVEKKQLEKAEGRKSVP
ncbi:MAG: hypothetical protein AB1705_09430 [Verrucomicrobiota bacterium]